MTAIYNNMLSRTPDADGLAFWVGAINSGSLTKGGACLSILSGALVNGTPQGLTDGNILLKKVSLAGNFTASLSATGKGSLYVGNNAAASMRAMLQNVTSTTDVTQFQSMSDAEIAVLTADYSPIAKIAGPSSTNTDVSVILDGSGSTDPQKLPITYSWEIVSKPVGSYATLFGSNLISPFFFADLAGPYIVSLTVTSGGQSDTKTVTITAIAVPNTPTTPTNATAICNDGTYSYSASRSGTCSHHGGVRIWL